MLAQLPKLHVRSPSHPCVMGSGKNPDLPQLDQPRCLGLIWLLERDGLFWSCVLDPQSQEGTGRIWGWEVRCGVKDSGPAPAGPSGLAEQGHQWEGQCHCTAEQLSGGTPEVHAARVGCKTSCSPDPTLPLEPLLAVLGRGETWHLLCHPFQASYLLLGIHPVIPFGWKSRHTAMLLLSLGDQL